MARAKVTSKGQITLPASVRQTLGLASGDLVESVETAPGRFEMIVATSSVHDLKGSAGPVQTCLTIDEMNEVIVQSATNFQ